MGQLQSLSNTIGHRKTKLLKELEAKQSSFRLARLPSDILRLILAHIYMNICDECMELCDTLAFSSARVACDDFAASARREYGLCVGEVWSETFETLEDVNAKMIKLMEVAPKFPRDEGVFDLWCLREEWDDDVSDYGDGREYRWYDDGR